MEDKEYWKPFDVIEDERGTTLQLHGTKEERKIVTEEDTPKILEAIINGWNIDVMYAVIQGELNICDVHMERNQEGKSVIEGRIGFLVASFEKAVAFSRASFEKVADFGGASFGNDVDFNGASFENDVDFNAASFGEKTYFDGASFNAGAYFDEASFDVGAEFGGVKMKYPADFKGVQIRENTVCKTILWNWVLRRLFWLPVWLMTIGRAKLPKATFTDVSTINTNTVIDTSSNPRLKRYIDDEQWIESWRRNPKGRWWREPVFWLWELTSHCGRSIGLWVFWSALLAVVFAFIYQAFGSDSITFSVDMAGKLPDFRAYLYYSVVTFTTLGFGDIIPKTHWARFAVGTEVVLGYVMLGGLISIFANKFARRS